MVLGKEANLNDDSLRQRFIGESVLAVELVQMRRRSRPAIRGYDAPIDDWGEGKSSDVPDVIEPRDMKVLNEGHFVCVVAVRSGNRPVINIVTPCRRNAARDRILRTHPISRRTHLRMCAVRELALEVKSNIFADPVATPQPTRRMHEGIARSWRPYGEETSFGVSRAAGIWGRGIVYQFKPRFKGFVGSHSMFGDL